MIGLIADIHGNIEALQAVIEDMVERKVDEIYCLGDIVGYGASPNECCDTIKRMDIHCVMGDHDYAAATGELLTWFQPDAQKVLKWTSGVLDRKNKLFLSVLPRKLTLDVEGVRLGLVHGSPWDELFEYVRPTVKESVLKKFLKEMDCQVLALGHTHVPFAKELNEWLVVNPGSVGQPRDGIAWASYAIIDPFGLNVKIIRKKYDLQSAVKKMQLAGLPELLVERLKEGI